jgi:hypothetical protein
MALRAETRFGSAKFQPLESPRQKRRVPSRFRHHEA